MNSDCKNNPLRELDYQNTSNWKNYFGFRCNARLILLSLCWLIALGIAVIWVTSYWTTIELKREHKLTFAGDGAGWKVTRFIGATRGGVYLAVLKDTWGSSWDAMPGEQLQTSCVCNGEGGLRRHIEAIGYIIDLDPDWHYLGFRFDRVDNTFEGDLNYFIVPLWLPFLVSFIWPFKSALAKIRRINQGHYRIGDRDRSN